MRQIAVTKPAVVPAAPAVARPAYAYLVVEVPADALVYLRGQRMTTTGTVRKFRVPTEQAGVDYTYAVRIEVERDGQKVSTEHYQAVRSGRLFNVKVSENSDAQLVAVASR